MKLSALAAEEATHLSQVSALAIARGLALGHPEKDPYVQGLLGAVRKGNLEGRVDRLLCCAIIEARSCERLKLLAEAVDDDDVRTLYDTLWRVEAGHHTLFVDLAVRSAERAGEKAARDVVKARLDVLLEHEAELVRTLPIRAAIH